MQVCSSDAGVSRPAEMSAERAAAFAVDVLLQARTLNAQSACSHTCMTQAIACGHKCMHDASSRMRSHMHDAVTHAWRTLDVLGGALHDEVWLCCCRPAGRQHAAGPAQQRAPDVLARVWRDGHQQEAGHLYEAQHQLPVHALGPARPPGRRWKTAREAVRVSERERERGQSVQSERG